MGADQRANDVLGTLLAELGWSPSQLAEAVNGLLGPGSVARSTVSDWLHQDRLPRHPLPTVVAHLISDALDREVPVVALWSGRAQPAEFWMPADHGLQLPWTAAGTVKVLDDWLGHTGGSIGMDRRIFLAVSGASLTAPVWGYVERLGIRGDSFAALADARRSITITPAMVDTVAATTAGIRDLGNAEGGNGDNLRFVHHHLVWVAKLLRNARGFHAAAEEARALLDSPGALDARPPYLAWFDSGALDTQLAESALILAAVSSRDGRALLDDATEAFERTAADPARTHRSVVFAAAWLARSHVAAGDLDQVVPTTQIALNRLPSVRSRRCELVLHRLEDDLAALPPARRPAAVRSLHDQLRATQAT